MKKLIPILLILSLSACANNPLPVLTPTAATAITNGLSALSSILQARMVSPSIITGISDVQQAISQDISGTTWAALVRTELTNLYSQLPLSVQNDTVVWASLAALEVILATVGA